ncbi:Uu.00g102740.m01.CDS01 [Anthostomella pinea]|uniref:Uu.00g102740.m01.CDS01 n=1 Tax=Anthostomella pinea TaxID=933095 RepID=A0AAI8VDH1_9PEZI|nr:Uu.00g102740.m01.CDS01 [Anthostomella pinea]
MAEPNHAGIAFEKPARATSLHCPPLSPDHSIRSILSQMRQWWSRIYTGVLEDLTSRAFTAVDSSKDQAVGTLLLRLCAPTDKGTGIWTMYNITPDHGEAAFKSMIDGMVEHRERLITETHFLIELFGVDHGYKGRGIGQRLLAMACEATDDSSREIFVQANASAKGFYCKQGFEVKGETVMPGELEYKEYMLVRPCSKRAS